MLAVQVTEKNQNNVDKINIEKKINKTKAKPDKALPSTNDSPTKSTVKTQVLPPDKMVNNNQEQTPDFIPSEEISEDLSVSFPIDI